MESQQSMNGPDQMKMVLGAVHFVCRSLAATVEVFLHKSRSFGERYLGLQAAAAVLVIFFSTAFWRGENVVPVLLFLVAYLVAYGCARLGVMARVKAGGVQVHTQYTGAPRILRWMGGIGEGDRQADRGTDARVCAGGSAASGEHAPRHFPDARCRRTFRLSQPHGRIRPDSRSGHA